MEGCTKIKKALNENHDYPQLRENFTKTQIDNLNATAGGLAWRKLNRLASTTDDYHGKIPKEKSHPVLMPHFNCIDELD
jgi:hypothetical protein